MQLTGAAAIDKAAADGWRAFLLCDDVGTGKTITLWLGALAIADRICARRADPCRILVLVDRPAAITIPHWRNTIAADRRRRPPDSDLLARPTAEAVVPQRPSVGALGHRDRRRVSPLPATPALVEPRFSSGSRGSTTHRPRHRSCCWRAPRLAQHPAELTYLGPVVAQLRGERPAEWSDFGDRLAGVGLPIVKGTFGKWGWNERAAADPLMQQEATEQVGVGWRTTTRR